MRNMIAFVFVLALSTVLVEAWSCCGRGTVLFQANSVARGRASKTQLEAKKDNKPPLPDFLFQEFKTAKGEVLDPYKVLKIKQTASIDEIKQAYRQLSRKYHADATRFRDVLPGRCNNKEEVRDEWERVKFSYEILRDPKLRLRYDRNVVIADPGAAMQRAALDAVGKGFQGMGQVVGKGIFGMGKGLWEVTAFTLEQISTKQEEAKASSAKANDQQQIANANKISPPPTDPTAKTNQPATANSEVSLETPVAVEM